VIYDPELMRLADLRSLPIVSRGVADHHAAPTGGTGAATPLPFASV